MSRLFQQYFLKGAQFYNLFNLAAKNAVEMAGLLVNVVNTDIVADREPIYKQIDKLENVGDDITHKIYLALDKVIFTPLNRKDIHTLASAVDDVADFIHEASERMFLYGIDDFTPSMKAIAAIILEAATEIQNAVNLLSIPKQGNNIVAACKRIKQYEQQSDQVYYNALAQLFATEKNAITLIKYREILYSLETTTNKCKKATEVLQAILVNSY